MTPAILLLLLLVVYGCGDPLEPASQITTLRVLAVRAEPPFVLPGAESKIDMEVWDGPRSPLDPSERAVSTLWLGTCVDPAGDRYDRCYPELHRVASTLSDEDLARSSVPEGVLGVGFGQTFTLLMPTDAITRRPQPPGVVHPYGIAYAFFIVCRGDLRHDPTASPASDPPIACYRPGSDRRVALTDTVFGYVPVYAYSDLSNQNPILEGITVGAGDGFVDACGAAKLDDCRGIRVEPIVLPASVEPSVTAWTAAAGGARPETLWVDYYTSAGKFTKDLLVVHDPVSGFAADYAGLLETNAPRGATVRVWAVVHDDRNGVAFAHQDVVVR